MNTHQATVTVWRACSYDLEIEPVATSKLTERINCLSTFYLYFDTWEEAHRFLVEKTRRQFAETENSLAVIKAKLIKLQSMKMPDGTLPEQEVN